MHIEVDQSGKIADTKVDTVLAYSNGRNFSIVIPAGVKRNCILYLRGYNLSGKNFYMRMFSTGLYFLLKKSIGTVDRVIIDTEYNGQECYIKEHLINLMRRSNIRIDPTIVQFKSIGKKSKAHKLSLSTFQNKQKANEILTERDILSGIRIKKDRGPK